MQATGERAKRMQGDRISYFERMLAETGILFDELVDLAANI